MANEETRKRAYAYVASKIDLRDEEFVNDPELYEAVKSIKGALIIASTTPLTLELTSEKP